MNISDLNPQGLTIINNFTHIKDIPPTTYLIILALIHIPAANLQSNN